MKNNSRIFLFLHIVIHNKISAHKFVDKNLYSLKVNKISTFLVIKKNNKINELASINQFIPRFLIKSKKKNKALPQFVIANFSHRQQPPNPFIY